MTCDIKEIIERDFKDFQSYLNFSCINNKTTVGVYSTIIIIQCILSICLIIYAGKVSVMKIKKMTIYDQLDVVSEK